MNICFTTFFKVLGQVRLLLVINLASVALSGIFSYFSAVVTHSIDIILICVCFTVIFRSIVAEFWINREMKVQASGMAFAEIVLTILFVAAALMLQPLYGFGCTVVLYAGYLYTNRDTFSKIILHLRK